MKKRQRSISVHQDIKSDPATLHNANVLGLVFDYLPTVDVRQCAQVNRRWTAITQHYNKHNENKFKARYPEIYETMMANNFVPKSWREEINAVSHYEKTFPKSFLQLKNNKVFIENWKSLFINRDSQGKSFVRLNLVHYQFVPPDKDNVKIQDIIDHLERIRPGVDLNDFLSRVSLNEYNELSHLGLKETNGVKEIIWHHIRQNEDDPHHLLAWAMLTGQPDDRLNALVKQLVDVNSEISYVIANDIGDCSLLHIAACLGFSEIARILLEMGATVDALSDGEMVDHYRQNTTPLYIACEFGHFDVAKVLIEHGANVNVCNDNGMRPIHEACEKHHIGLVKLLLENNDLLEGIDDRSIREDSSLEKIIERGFVNIIEVLINHRRQPDLSLEMKVLNVFEDTPEVSGFDSPDMHRHYEQCRKIIILVLKKIESSTLPEAPLSPWVIQYLLKLAQEKYPNEDEITQNSHDILQLEQHESLIKFLCYDKPDLHLLCAIHAKKSEEVIKSIVRAGAKVNGSEKYDIIPINYAFKFNRNAFFALAELGAYQYYDPQNYTFDLSISCKA